MSQKKHQPYRLGDSGLGIDPSTSEIINSFFVASMTVSDDSKEV
jgi:hypothetical protein